MDESESELESGPSFRRGDDMVGMSDENSNDQSDDATHCVRYTRDSSSYHQDVDDITTGVEELNIDESRCKSRTDSSDQSECSTSSDDSQLSEEQCVTDSEQHTVRMSRTHAEMEKCKMIKSVLSSFANINIYKNAFNMDSIKIFSV